MKKLTRVRRGSGGPNRRRRARRVDPAVMAELAVIADHHRSLVVPAR